MYVCALLLVLVEFAKRQAKPVTQVGLDGKIHTHKKNLWESTTIFNVKYHHRI